MLAITHAGNRKSGDTQLTSSYLIGHREDGRRAPIGSYRKHRAVCVVPTPHLQPHLSSCPRSPASAAPSGCSVLRRLYGHGRGFGVPGQEPVQ